MADLAQQLLALQAQPAAGVISPEQLQALRNQLTGGNPAVELEGPPAELAGPDPKFAHLYGPGGEIPSTMQMLGKMLPNLLMRSPMMAPAGGGYKPLTQGQQQQIERTQSKVGMAQQALDEMALQSAAQQPAPQNGRRHPVALTMIDFGPRVPQEHEWARKIGHSFSRLANPDKRFYRGLPLGKRPRGDR